MNFREELNKTLVECCWKSILEYLEKKRITENFKDVDLMVAINANRLYVKKIPDGERQDIFICDNNVTSYQVFSNLKDRIKAEDFEITSTEDISKSGTFTFKIV